MQLTFVSALFEGLYLYEVHVHCAVLFGLLLWVITSTDNDVRREVKPVSVQTTTDVR